MLTKPIYIYILISFLIGSCKAQEQKEQYLSIATDLKKYNLNGPVKMMRSFAKINEEELTKDQIKLNDAQGQVYGDLGVGYYEFDKNGIKSKLHTLPDSINQVLSDTIKIYKKNDGTRYIYIYDKEDYKNKKTITQTFKTPKWVFNPYRIHLNKNSYRTYNVLMNKDSTYKQQQDIYIYIYNR